MKKTILKFVQLDKVVHMMTQERIIGRISRYNTSLAHYKKKEQDYYDAHRECVKARNHHRGHGGGVDTVDSEYYLRRSNSSLILSNHARSKTKRVKEAKNDYKELVRRLYGERYTIPK